MNSENAYKKILNFWRDRNIKTGADLAEILNGFGIAFAYNSGKIENESITYNDTREIFDHDGVTSYTGDLRTLFELRNARDAYEWMIDAYDEHRVMDEEFIKTAQFLLTQNTYDTRRWQLGERPGEYKHHDFVTGKEEVGASPEEVQEELHELLLELIDISERDVLTAVAYFHAKFENIHPFADGNGRTGRLAMNYLLIVNNHPPITIHQEDRKEYYDALESWDKSQELMPMKEFLETQLIKTWAKRLQLQ